MSAQYLERVNNLFEFLKQYNGLKNPIITTLNKQEWQLWLDEIPKHPLVHMHLHQEGGETPIFSVKKVEIPQVPSLSQSLEQWLEKGWDDPTKQVKLKKKIQEQISAGLVQDEEIEIEKEYRTWLEKRSKWVQKANEIQKINEVFNVFYALYARMKKEPEAIELLLGDGHLYYKKVVEHPILLQAVTLEFDATIPEFRIYPSDKMPELYKNILSCIPEANYDLLIDAYKTFGREQISPMSYVKTNEFLNQICYALSPNGKIKDDVGALEMNVDFPQIYRRPVLFLRKRNLGFSLAIDSILEDLGTQKHTPKFLRDIVGATKPTNIPDHALTLEKNKQNVDDHILLTKPANHEQLLVARHLESNEAVLVQGPPGTGKTHTIANIIGHLLSEGKSILVTSYSEKALSVVKEQVVEELQPLCLSLLSSNESREELEKTLENIHIQRGQLEKSDLLRRITLCETQRKNDILELNQLKSQLKEIRMAEYTPIQVLDKAYKPIEAVTYLEEHKETCSWIQGPVAKGIACSLSEEELTALYETNTAISEEEEIIFDCELPGEDQLLSPMQLQHFVNLEQQFKNKELDQYSIYWHNAPQNLSVQSLKKLAGEIQRVTEPIKLDCEWILETLEAGKEECTKEKWKGMLQSIYEVYQLAIECSEELIKYNPQIKELDEKIKVLPLLDQIIDKLEQGGKLNKVTMILNPSIKALIQACRVNGETPQTIEEFKTLKNYYNLSQKRELLKARWNRQMSPLGAERIEHMGVQFEINCKKYCSVIEENINWYNKQWLPLVSEMSCMGIMFDKLIIKKDVSHDKYSSIRHLKEELTSTLLNILEYQVFQLESRSLQVSKQVIQEKIQKHPEYIKSDVLTSTQKALRENQVALYTSCYEVILENKNLAGIIQQRRSLISRLSATAPKWAQLIANRDGIYGEAKMPASFASAWIYRQLADELEQRNNQPVDKVEAHIVQLEQQIKVTTRQLATHKAWLHKLVAFDQDRSQVQAIEGWKQLIMKIGAGKGKNTEMLKAEARKLMPKCQSAVPAWIMPLNKVAENFNPKENKFDVVIIDEASQADVMALVALYLGKQVLIVGDNEQVSPLAIGEKAEDVERIVKEYLYDIPHHYLYSGKFSIYDLAQVAGYQPVRLKEHFRCVPAIIEYSNRLAYNGQIQPLRDTSSVQTTPAIVTHFVEDGEEVDGTNPAEATKLVELLMACCQQEAYKNKTFGVITLRGDKQSALIENMIQSQMDPLEYRMRNILCGNPSHFQGDERDIIFISMVDSKPQKGTMRLTSYGIDNLYKKRYNVAMSRARDQVWVLHSFDPEEHLKDGDIRKELLDYCMNYQSELKIEERMKVQSTSKFEIKVLNKLLEKGYQVYPQYQVGEYYIDMVVCDGEQKVAIACEGGKWQVQNDIEEHMDTQSVLERLGWRFIRLRASEFFADEHQITNRLINQLSELGISSHKQTL